MGEQERVKERVRGTLELDGYERTFQNRAEFLEHQLTGKIVVKGSERPWELCRQGYCRFYLHPLLHKDAVLRDWYAFMLDIKTHSGRHRHQGGLIIFVVEGKGGTEVDGERLAWEAGDLVLLPVKPNGVEHKHYNAEPGKSCRWLAIVYTPLWDHVASEFAQLELSPDFIAKYGQPESFITGKVENTLGSRFFEQLDESTLYRQGVESASSRTAHGGPQTFYDRLMELRDSQRALRKTASWLVKGHETPWEQNPQGIMQWLMHPAKKDIVIHTLLTYIQEIPPGSRSGKQRYQGNMLIYIIGGKGYTVIDGVKHPWEAGDVVQLPLRRDGVVFQHFNSDPQKPARFLACEPNHVNSAGMDRGSGFEQLEESPDFGSRYEPAA